MAVFLFLQNDCHSRDSSICIATCITAHNVATITGATSDTAASNSGLMLRIVRRYLPK